MFHWVRFLAATAAVLIPLTASAAPNNEANDDRTLSPYFHVLGDDAEGVLPLKSTRADVNVAGVIAHVRVTQVYQNTGTVPIEAIYVFPGSTRAAVFGMQMTIGERTITAKINKKEQARKLYEEAKSQGKSASLLEQHRPNVFQMNVANILPGDEIKVEMDYSEVVVPTDGFYEFVYPAVVGPRYSEKKASDSPPSEAWVENPYLEKGVKAPYDWDIALKLSSGMPIQKISSPSHQITPRFTGESTATVALGGSDSFVQHDPDNPGNRDFVLRYRLAGGAIESGLLLFPGEDENFFLTMVQPPQRVKPSQLPAREYVFIMDVSGSMSGFPLTVSKDLMRDLLGDLRPEDRFNVLMFAGGNRLFQKRSVSATRKNVDAGLAFVSGARGGGGTQLLNALDTALSLPSDDDVSRTFVVITDGYVNVENETFTRIADNLGEANLFAFGIGSSVNRHIIEGMARVGLGEPFIVLNNAEAGPTANKFREYIESPVLTNIGVEFTRGFQAYDVEPKHIPDLFAQRPLLIFGKYKGSATGRITVTGTTGEGHFEKDLRVGKFEEDPDNQALRYLWARHRVRNLADMNPRMSKDDVEEVTRLGLEYNLMTAYTSFVAIDSEVRNANGDLVSVKQPVPMPAGVENSAVGGSTSATGRVAYGAAAPRKRKVLRNAPAPTPTFRAPSSLAADSEMPEERASTRTLSRGDFADGDDSKMAGKKEDAPVRLARVRVLSIAKGSASKNDVERAIRQALRSVSTCGLPSGTIEVEIEFAADGSVTVVRPTTRKHLSQCVRVSLTRSRLTSGDVVRAKVRLTFK